jgi:hypothetical protein
VEQILGHGTQLSKSTGHTSTGAFVLERVAYRSSGLVLTYAQATSQPAKVFVLYTTSAL